MLSQAIAQEPIVHFIVSPDGTKLVTFSRNLMIRVWDPATGECRRSWKGHRLPVQAADFDPTSTLLATGAADKTVMVWDVDNGYATHSFRGHESLISAVKFQPHPVSVQRLMSAGENGEVRCWDLVSNVCVAATTEHYSSVTAILFSPDAHAHYMITCGRDKVMNVWDTRDFDSGISGSGKPSSSSSASASEAALKATVTTNEDIEGAVMYPAMPSTTASGAASGADAAGNREMIFATVGVRGMLRKWKLVITGATKATRKYACGVVGSTTVANLRHGSASAASSTSASASNDNEELPVSRQFETLLLRQVPASGAAPQLSAASSADAAAGAGGKRRRSQDASSSSSSSLPVDFDLLAVTRDQVLSIVDPTSLSPRKSIVGFSDQFTDVKYIPQHPSSTGKHLLAIATNSEQFRIVDVDSFDSKLCDGHTGIVLAVSPSPDGTLVATSSKDRTLRIWDVATGACVGVCEGHTESVGAVSFPCKASNFMRANPSKEGGASVGSTSWVASGSKDRTIKVWQLGPLLSKLPSPRPDGWSIETAPIFKQAVHSARTISAAVAHEKDINAIAVAPHDRLIASASQDKTIKLWSAPDLAPVATLRGHKRGVWSIAFSPVDQLLASASGDNTIRLWAVTPSAGFACLRTFEGHDASVLCVRFLRKGAQLVSAGADGLVKVWSVKDSECVNTFDAHTDKIWALAVRPADMNSATDAIGAAGDDDGADDDDNADASGDEEMDGGEGKSSGKKSKQSKRKSDGAGSKQIPEYEIEIVTGGGDSVLNVWRDVTSKTAESEVEAAEAALMKQQTLYNAMSSRDYAKAITLTLELDQPGRCGDIINELLEVGPTPPTRDVSSSAADARYRDAILREIAQMESEEKGMVSKASGAAAGLDASGSSSSSSAGSASASASAGTGVDKSIGLNAKGVNMLTTVLKTMSAVHLVSLLGYIREWNTQSRHGLLAQQLLYLLLRTIPTQKLLAMMTEAKNGRSSSDDDGSNESGKVVEKVIPGVGRARVAKAAGALDQESTLTPIANPVSSVTDGGAGSGAAGAGDGGMVGTLAATSSQQGAAQSQPSTAAAAELRGLVSALLPYSERHLERLDRLMVSTYLIDGTLHSMRALMPENDNPAARLAEEELRSRLMGSGAGTVAGGAGAGAGKNKRGPVIVKADAHGSSGDSSDDGSDSSDYDEDGGRGSGWLPSRSVGAGAGAGRAANRNPKRPSSSTAAAASASQYESQPITHKHTSARTPFAGLTTDVTADEDDEKVLDDDEAEAASGGDDDGVGDEDMVDDDAANGPRDDEEDEDADVDDIMARIKARAKGTPAAR